MSSQLKEKQQQKDNKRDLEADKIFNQQLFNTLAYAGAGFGAGLVASIFLKHRKALTLLGAGSGALYGASNFMTELNQFNRFKDLASQSQQPHTLKREDQLATKNWENYMPKQESLSQQKRYGGSGDNDDKGSKSSSESKSRGNKPEEKKKGHEETSAKSKTQSKPSSMKESGKSSQEQQKGESPKNVSQGKEQSERSPSRQSESKSESKGQGQHLQDFKSNKEAGKPAPGESRLYRGAERNVESDRKIEDLRDQQNRVEQDRWGKSKRTGNKMKVEPPPENIAGGQFSGQGLSAHSQVNAVIE